MLNFFKYFSTLSVAIILIFHVVLQVFVEFENATQRCSWVKVYDVGVKSVMVEDSIVWVSRSDSTGTTGASASSTLCPALVSAWTGITQDCLCFSLFHQFVFSVQLLERAFFQYLHTIFSLVNLWGAKLAALLHLIQLDEESPASVLAHIYNWLL